VEAKVRILITGGGTGGHVFPGIAIAQELLKRPEVEVLYVGKNNGPESKWVKEKGLSFEGIQASGFPRGLTLRLFTFWLDLMKGFRQAGELLKKFEPRVVFSTGGYVSVPVSVVAAWKGIPVFLFEPNVRPGLAARVLALVSTKVFTGFEKTAQTFARAKSVWVGIPVRVEILDAVKEKALGEWGLDRNKTTILLLGGSQGAHALNQYMAGAIQFLAEGDQAVQFLMMTGLADYQKVADQMEKCPLKVILRPFFTNIQDAYAAADLVVARAGAITCAELLSRGLPSILIPYPHASGHQEANARALENAGAAVVILEKELEDGTLSEKLAGLLNEPETIKSMGLKAKTAFKERASAVIAEDLFQSAQIRKIA